MSRNCWNCFWRIFKHRSTSLVNFYCSGVLHFVTRSFEICLKVWASKAAFWENSVNIDFLENKSIFSQTNYAVICLGLPNIRIWAELIFDLLPPNVWPLVTFALKFYLSWNIRENCRNDQNQPVKNESWFTWKRSYRFFPYCFAYKLCRLSSSNSSSFVIKYLTSFRDIRHYLK